MFHVPEWARWTDAPEPWTSSRADGNNGAFRVDSPEPGWRLMILAADSEGWQHVSVHAHRGSGKGAMRTPTWREMAYVKRLFWDDDDVAVQYYPRAADYVNTHPHTLHWWRPTDVDLPTPPPSFV